MNRRCYITGDSLKDGEFCDRSDSNGLKYIEINNSQHQ